MLTTIIVSAFCGVVGGVLGIIIFLKILDNMGMP